MFCTNCGAQVDDNLRFCTNCGARIDAAQPVQQPVTADTQPYDMEQQQYPYDNGTVQLPNDYQYQYYGGTYAPAQGTSSGNSAMIGLIVAGLAILLSILAFCNPFGGMFKYALRSIEDVPAIFTTLVAPVVPLVMGVEMDLASGVIAGLVSVLAAIVGLVAMILLIIFVVKGLSGKSKPKLAKVAFIMCLVVTLLQVITISSFNNSIKNSFNNLMGGLGGGLSMMSGFDMLDMDDDCMEDYLESLGIDEDDVRDLDDATKVYNKIISNMIKPTMYHYLVIIVSIAGIVLIKKQNI